MKLNIQKYKRLIATLLSILTVCLILICMAAPAFAAENYTLSGTWTFNDDVTHGTWGMQVADFYFYAVVPNDTFELETVRVDCTGFYIEPGLDVYSLMYEHESVNDFVSNYLYSSTNGWDAHYFGSTREQFIDSLIENFGSADPVLVERGYSCLGDGIKTVTFETPQQVSSEFYWWFVSNAQPDNLTSDVSDALSSVVGWVGSVVNSLLGGQLIGLLALVAIPVAIVIVLLVSRLIRRLWWGA